MRISDWSSDVCSSDLEGPSRDGKRVLLVIASALADKAAQRYGLEQATVLGHAGGKAMERLKLQHPFYPREVPVILGDHVSAEDGTGAVHTRSEEHTSELQSLMRISYAVFCLKKKKRTNHKSIPQHSKNA